MTNPTKDNTSSALVDFFYQTTKILFMVSVGIASLASLCIMLYFGLSVILPTLGVFVSLDFLLNSWLAVITVSAAFMAVTACLGCLTGLLSLVDKSIKEQNTHIEQKTEYSANTVATLSSDKKQDTEVKHYPGIFHKIDESEGPESRFQRSLGGL